MRIISNVLFTWSGRLFCEYRVKLSLALLICIVYISPAVMAAHNGDAGGKLDLTFSQDGKLFDFLVNGGQDIAYATALQADGKIIVAGRSAFGLVSSCTVTRYNPDGTPDPTFGSDGRTNVPIGTDFICFDVAIQANGKIVVVGYLANFEGLGGSSDFIVVRFNIDGSLDPSFDLDGVAITALGTPGMAERAYAVAIQPDGKIVVAGHGYTSRSHFALVRYNPDGSLDTTFSSDGIVVQLSQSDESAYAMSIQADGKIVCAGYISGGGSDIAVYRWNPNGSLDTSFGSSGRVITSGEVSWAYAIAIQPDGKIVVAGNGEVADPPPSMMSQLEFALLRYNTDGSLDASFSSDGIVLTHMPNSHERSHDLTLQSDGKIVTAGNSRSRTTGRSSFALQRHNIDGSPDVSFGSNGQVFTSLGVPEDSAEAMMIQPDGKIVAVGHTNGSGILSQNDFAVIRYNSDGSLDPSFSSDGIISDDVGHSISVARAVSIQGDGKFVVAGHTQASEVRDFGVTRYNEDGTRDTSFGSGGKVVTSMSNAADEARAIAVQADGKIVVVGVTGWIDFGTEQRSDLGVVRYNTDGSLDTSFDTDGKVIGDFGVFDFANGVAIQPNGKIVVAGWIAGFGFGGVTLLRYNTDGSPDPDFGSDGRVTLSGTFARSEAIAIQPDGKIVAAGYGYNSTDQDFVVVRFNADGSLDNSFDGDGIVTTPLGSADDFAYGLAIQPDGKIIAVGSSLSGSNSDFAVVRYNTDGSLDTSFDLDGKLTTPVLSGADQANAVVIQTNGKIVVGGYANNGFLNNDFAMVRYNTDGSLDTTYDSDGKFTFDFWGNSHDFLYGMALDRVGRAVVVGDARGNFAVARVTGDLETFGRTPFDYDADGRSDISVFRPATGDWYLQQSTAGFTGVNFGSAEDKIVPADYDGDGKTDVAVYRPSTGIWYVTKSATGTSSYTNFGIAEDLPTAADYDGDGRADISVFRPSTGTWYRLNSLTGQFVSVQFGTNGDKPTVGDFDGDGRADSGVYRPSTGVWYQTNSSDGSFFGEHFGIAVDRIVPADYDGDGRTDIAIYRPADGLWYVKNSATATYTPYLFGLASDIPVPGDYDGDGRADIAVFRPSNGTWYIANSSTGGFTINQFGQNGDRPTQGAFNN